MTTQQPPPLQTYRRDLPPSLVEAVHRGLAKNPAQRFATCREFVEAVLRDVPPLESELDLARLLCPNPKCSSVLKLPTSAAGRKGKCPKCQMEMKVANDLGALWLLDEARRQKRGGGDGDRTEESAGVMLADEGGLDSFKPVSSTTPIERASRRQQKPSPWLILGGVAAAVLILVSLWRAIGGPAVTPQRPTYQEQLAAALKTLEERPADAAANKFVGEHWCFKKEEWETGLPYLAKSGNIVIAVQAANEIVARGARPIDPGSFLRLARKWWDVANQEKVNTPASTAAIQKHAASLYCEHVGAIVNAQDITLANQWLERDKNFRVLVHDKRPRPIPDPPQALVDKTLIAWVRLHNLTQRAGSALTIESVRDDFDGIVFGEKSPGRWYVGSNVESRSPAKPDAVALEQDANSRPVCLAIVYKGNRVTTYRDGKVYGGYTIRAPFRFERKDSRVLLGLRHTTAADHACLAADIDDARIYDCALSAEEIAALQPNVISGTRPVAWWNFNEGSVRDVFNCFQQVTVKNCTVRDGQLVLNGRDSYVVCVPQMTPADKPPAKPDVVLSTPQFRNSIGMDLMLIPAGTFQMGSNDGQADKKPTHEVRITKPFYLGVTEVTNAQWKAVMGSVPSDWKDDDRPVVRVSWDDVVAFSKKLSEFPAERQDGRAYRLPTEAEWEYACRAGTSTSFSFGNSDAGADDFAWFSGNADGQTRPVRQKKPNPWGLHDMHGNVWEWCSDWHGAYPASAVSDPQGPATGSKRIYRGGCWKYDANTCRSDLRVYFPPSVRFNDAGFRLAMTLSGTNRPKADVTPNAKYMPLPLDKVATAVSTRGMFYSPDHPPERLIFADWGPKRFREVPFSLVDPRGDSVNNVVLLHGPHGYLPPRMPKVVSLPVGEPARAIHLLSGVAGWGFPAIRDHSTSMIVRLVYADGKIEDHALVNGEHIADYIRRVDVPKSEFAFNLDGRQVRYLRIDAGRTEPIASIDFVKGQGATAPIVMAITLEMP